MGVMEIPFSLVCPFNSLTPFSPGLKTNSWSTLVAPLVVFYLTGSLGLLGLITTPGLIPGRSIGLMGDLSPGLCPGLSPGLMIPRIGLTAPLIGCCILMGGLA